MKDQNLLDAFTYGTNYLSDSNVDFEDKAAIRASLEKCALNMLSVIHKYEGNKCYNCKNRITTPYGTSCQYDKVCFESSKFDHFESIETDSKGD